MIRILLVGYLPIALLPPSKLQDILGKVTMAFQITNPDVWVPCINVILTSTSTVSTSSWHKKSMQEAVFRLQYTSHLKNKILRVNLYLMYIYMVSCTSVMKENHVISCFNIK